MYPVPRQVIHQTKPPRVSKKRGVSNVTQFILLKNHDVTDQLRLTTIRNADLIVALKDGRAMEMGTHEELMKRKGLYYDLVESQLAGKDEEADTFEEETPGEASKLNRNSC